MEQVPEPWTILDIGGEPVFWAQMGFVPPVGSRLLLLNLGPGPEQLPDGIEWVEGDARDLSRFPDASIPVVFSNSVIEHLGGRTEQARMAREVRRVGQRYFVQTPNYRFPMEPHFLVPFIHWLPTAAREWLVWRFRPGWYGASVVSRADAEAVVRSIELLRLHEFGALFPDAEIVPERLLGLSKSFIAIYGWTGEGKSD